ncbi:MAG: hypothetical protein L7U87_06205 [Chlamydiales bacterium]|nr:hypothetical protein [Chlamydiales bacterium]
MKIFPSSVIKSVQQSICRYTPEIIKQNKVLTGIALIALSGIYDLYVRELWLSPEKKFERLAPVEQLNYAKELYQDGNYTEARKYFHLYLEKRKSLSIFQFYKHIYRMSVNYHLYKPGLSRKFDAMYTYAMLCKEGRGGVVDDVSARTYFGKIKDYSYDMLEEHEKNYGSFPFLIMPLCV